MSYSEQSKKLLNLQSIKIKDYFPSIEINTNRLEKNNSDLLIKGKKIAFGIDSFEDYKMWYEEDFVKLADKLYEKNLFDYIYLICGKEKSYLAKNIKRLSKKDNRSYLKAENRNYPDLYFNNDQDVQIWGVVIYSIHKCL